MPSDKSLPVYEALRTLVPELAESEDERMLQTIIRGFENCKRNGMEIFNNTKIDDILVYLEKQKEIGIQWLKSDNVKNPDKPYIDKAGMFYTTDGRMCYASEIGKQKSVEWDEYTKINLDRALQIIKKAKGTLQGYQSDDGIYECDKAIECLEHFLYRGLEIEKHTECIEFANEFDSQISHLLVSVLNGEHEYNKDFVKYAAQSLLGYAKNELKSDELNEREKLMKALQTSNAQIGELVEENYKLKEQKPVEIDEYEIIKKHITEDVLSSEVNKRLKECGWYVTEEPVKWEEEDQKSLNRAINICISDFGEDCQTAKFLKSLPKRFNLQSMQEWSDEDETAFGDLMWCIKQAAKSAKNENDMGNIWFAENWVKNRLKFLRPQSKKELSIKKAIKWLDDTFCFLDNSSGRGRDCEITTHDFDSLEEMYDSFRKAVIVDSEPSWKPSKEQMKWLKDVIETVPMTCRQQVPLESLYNDLLKLM